MYKVYLTTLSSQFTGQSCADDLIRVLHDPVYVSLEIHVYDHKGGELLVLKQIECALEEALAKGKRISLIFEASVCSSAAALYVFCQKLSNRKLGKKLIISTHCGNSGYFELCFHQPRVRISANLNYGLNTSGLKTQNGDLLVFRSDWAHSTVKSLIATYPDVKSHINRLFRGAGDRLFSDRFEYALNNIQCYSIKPSTNTEQHYYSKGDVIFYLQ